MNKGSIVERLCSDLDRKEPRYKSPTLLYFYLWPYNRQLHQCNVFVEIDGLPQETRQDNRSYGCWLQPSVQEDDTCCMLS